MQYSGFFHSVAGDRRYNAVDYAAYFSSLVTNGVFPLPGTGLEVISNSNMTVSISPGKAWINGYIYRNDAPLDLTCDAADALLGRIDRIVIRLDTTARSIVGAIKKGTASSTPSAPALQRDSDIYELGIADVIINPGTLTISQILITDLRMNTTVCGWVNSLIQADTTMIFNQYLAWYNAKIAEQESWYDATTLAAQQELDTFQSSIESDWAAWFANVQSQLSGDIAGQLLVAIEAIPKVHRGTVAPASPSAIDFWFKEV